MDLQTPIKEVMTKEVTYVGDTDLLEKVQDIFANNIFNHLPVIDNKNKVVGIVSRQDYQKIKEIFSILKDFGAEVGGKNFALSMIVKDMMTQPIVTIQPGASIEFALGIFRENLFHAMPVVDDQNQLMGMLSTYDLLHIAFKK